MTVVTIVGRPFKDAWLDAATETALYRLQAQAPSLVRNAHEGCWCIGEVVEGEAPGEAQVERVRAFCESLPDGVREHSALLPFGVHHFGFDA